MVAAIREPALSNSWFVRLAAMGVLAMSLALTACGRKGPLDPPPRASAQPAGQQQAAAAPEQQAAERPGPSNWPLGQPDAPDDLTAHTPQGQKKPFFLDWLLN
jgi:predicted small lipoprotein YifL